MRSFTVGLEQPYCCTTAITAPEEVYAIHEGVPRSMRGGRALAFGILTSWRTLTGRRDEQPNASRYAELDMIGPIVEAAYRIGALVFQSHEPADEDGVVGDPVPRAASRARRSARCVRSCGGFVAPASMPKGGLDIP